MPLGINLFGAGNSKAAQEQSSKDCLRDWQHSLRSEARSIERSIKKIEQEEGKIKKDIKAIAKNGGDPKSIELLAKSLVRSNKAKARLYTARSTMQATSAELASVVASMRLADTIKTSVVVMRQMNTLVNIPELTETMSSMRKEMMHAGLVDEMMDEAMEDMDGPDMEEEAQAEVDKVLDELAIDASVRIAISKPDAAMAQTTMPETVPAAASMQGVAAAPVP